VDLKCCSLPKESYTIQNCRPEFDENARFTSQNVDKDVSIDVTITHSINLKWNWQASTPTEFQQLSISVTNMPQTQIRIFANKFKNETNYKWNRNRIKLRNNSETNPFWLDSRRQATRLDFGNPWGSVDGWNLVTIAQLNQKHLGELRGILQPVLNRGLFQMVYWCRGVVRCWMLYILW